LLEALGQVALNGAAEQRDGQQGGQGDASAVQQWSVLQKDGRSLLRDGEPMMTFADEDFMNKS